MFYKKNIPVVLTHISVSAADAQSTRSFINSRYDTTPNRRYRLWSPYYQNQNFQAYQLNPYSRANQAALAKPTLPPVTGPVQRYSPEEYGRIVRMALDAAKANDPAGTGFATRPSIIEMTTGPQVAGVPTYRPASARVTDVLDRGILLLSTGEEVRLRGITIPTTSDKNETNRIYAREAMQVLRGLVVGQEIAVLLDEPLRDSSGKILGTILMADGTELNRRMLEMGYGTLKPEDFGNAIDYSDMETAQSNARTMRLGIWSKSF